MDKKPAPHVYGAPDEDNRQPEPQQGFRGERAADSPRPDQTRRVGGITIEEESGVAAAENASEATKTENGQ